MSALGFISRTAVKNLTFSAETIWAHPTQAIVPPPFWFGHSAPDDDLCVQELPSDAETRLPSVTYDLDGTSQRVVGSKRRYREIH
jgi:hypothetical protein